MIYCSKLCCIFWDSSPKELVSRNGTGITTVLLDPYRPSLAFNGGKSQKYLTEKLL